MHACMFKALWGAELFSPNPVSDSLLVAWMYQDTLVLVARKSKNLLRQGGAGAPAARAVVPPVLIMSQCIYLDK